MTVSEPAHVCELRSAAIKSIACGTEAAIAWPWLPGTSAQRSCH
jgi:hypothetical protein